MPLVGLNETQDHSIGGAVFLYLKIFKMSGAGKVSQLTCPSDPILQRIFLA